MDITLFTYARPHWKTYRFLEDMVAHGHTPNLIVASPWRHLDIPKNAVITVKHHCPHPEALARRYDIVYLEAGHDAKGLGEGLGVIGGARILPKSQIERFRVGILNMHPGLIPESRGLSNVPRAIASYERQYITAHLIDERIDAGLVLATYPVQVEPDDTIFDLGERMIDLQVANLHHAIGRAIAGFGRHVPPDVGGYRKPLGALEEWRIIATHWERYKNGRHQRDTPDRLRGHPEERQPNHRELTQKAL